MLKISKPVYGWQMPGFTGYMLTLIASGACCREQRKPRWFPAKKRCSFANRHINYFDWFFNLNKVNS